MALLIETIRSSILDSIKGRKIGLNPAGYLAGPQDIVRQVTDLTSGSTATAIPAYGAVNVAASSLATSAAGGTFLLSNPVPGVGVVISNVATSQAATGGSTAMTFIRPSTAFYMQSTEGSTMTTLNLTWGSAVELFGLSTALYLVKSRTSLAGSPMNGTT